MNYKALILAIASAAAVNTAVASTGTMNISGSVKETSCVVTGMTSNVSFGDILAADLQDLEHTAVHRSEDVVVSVSGCPDTMTSVTLTPTYTAELGDGPRVALTGDMRGAGLWLLNGGDQIYSGTGIRQNLASNATTFTLSPTLVRFHSGGNSGAADVTAGDFSAAINMTMTYD